MNSRQTLPWDYFTFVPHPSAVSEQAANGGPNFQRADAGGSLYALGHRPGRFVYHYSAFQGRPARSWFGTSKPRSCVLSAWHRGR
jgi:hypothetical protein